MWTTFCKTKAYGAIAPKSLGCALKAFLCKGDYEQTDGHFELYINPNSWGLLNVA